MPGTEQLLFLSTEKLKRSLLLPTEPTSDQLAEAGGGKKKKNHSRFRSDFMPCGFLLVIQMLATICEEK